MKPIDEVLWKTQYAILRARFNHVLPVPETGAHDIVSKRYKRYAEERLTNDELVLAVDYIFVHDTAFPSPARLVEAFELARAARVEEQARLILAVADEHGQDGFYKLPRHLQEKLDNAALWKRAVLSVTVPQRAALFEDLITHLSDRFSFEE